MVQLVAGGLAFAEAAEADASASLPILPYIPELIFGIVAFVIIYAIAHSKFVPAMERMYAERRDAIEGDMSRAETAVAEANQLKAEYESQLVDARADAARIRQEAREQGAAIISEMRGEAQAEAARIVEAGEAQIEAQRAQALRRLQGEVGRMSTDLASRIVGETLHEETRQRGIVERFLSELETGQVQREAVGRSADGAGS